MKRIIPILCFTVAIATMIVVSCVHKPQVQPANGNFPPAIANIMITKCAVSGCHNAASYKNSDGLLLDTWEHLMQGGVSGAEVVAYSPKYSPLLYFCNTDSTLGTVAIPTMPVSTNSLPLQPLTHAEYTALVDWVASGAPDANGNIPFATNTSTRQKIYITQQGCNLLAVIDAQSKLVMRYIPLATTPDGSISASPHDVTVSSDGMYAYVPFIEGSFLDKIDTRTDQVVAYANVGATGGGADTGGGGWSIVSMSPQDTSLMVTGYYWNNVVNVNTASMTVNQNLSIDQRHGYPPTYWGSPHGVMSNSTFDTFFVALQWGNIVTKYSFTNSHFYYKYISVDHKPLGLATSADSSLPDPHQLQMTPDFSKYFVTLQGTGQVVVIDAHTDSILATIPVGAWPQEMDICPSKNYLFVACMEDGNAGNQSAGGLGSVYVIDYNTYQVVKVLNGDFYQPHDVTVDEQDGLVYITSTNFSSTGPPPHHVTGCGPRAGWYTVYDLNTLQPADNKRYELTYFPYASAARF